MQFNLEHKSEFVESLLEKEDYEVIKRVINKTLKLFENPDELDVISYNNSNYSAVCMMLGEVLDIVDDKCKCVEISSKYMLKIRDNLYNKEDHHGNSLFSGYCDVGFAAYSLYQVTSIYGQFINALNEIIVINVRKDIDNINLRNDLRPSDYDTISGLAGVARYLLLFKDDGEIRKCIEDILCYIVKLTDDIEVLGVKVPGWHIASKNHFLVAEKEYYKNGSFNFGLSHGIAGPLTFLAIALSEGVEVRGQKKCIKKILRDFNKFCYVNNNGYVYWPGIVSFEDYIEEKPYKGTSNASWCYGTPGIARAIYLAGKSINDTESMNLGIKAIAGLCEMNEEMWGLYCPTMCHGYSGLLAVVQSMHKDTSNPVFELGRKKILKKLLSYIDEDAMFGFNNNGDSEENNITLLSGVTGIILSLLPFIKPTKTDWMKHLLID